MRDEMNEVKQIIYKSKSNLEWLNLDVFKY